jgi:hypothetical protein
MIEVESNGEQVTLTIRCDQCEGGVYRFAVAHLKTLTKILPAICAQAGVDLTEGALEARVFEMGDPDAAAAARAFYEDFVQRRKHRQH